MEPRAKNSYSVPRPMWMRWSEDERVHYNKMFLSLYMNKEKFIASFPSEEWTEFCKKIAMHSTDMLRRGKLAEYYRYG